MNLTLFFRLICMSVYQSTTKLDYAKTYLFCPRVVAKDGFNISLQINRGNYCSSENGYRKLGHTWQNVEFGYPSESDELLIEFADSPEELPNTIGSIPIDILEQLFLKHGGIDWDKTISIETYEKGFNQ